MVSMLNALEHDSDHIHSEMTSYYISNPTAGSAALSNRIEQEAVYKSWRENGPSEVALAARPVNARKRSTLFCVNTTCEGPSGHLIPDCWSKGGGMEGKHDEILAAKAKAREMCNKNGATKV